MNTYGRILKLTTFGESHGCAIGGVLDGVPTGITLDLEAIQCKMALRRPGANPLVSPRNETDKVEFLSGLQADGTTTGAPIGFIIQNSDAHSTDYQAINHLFRPAHADYTYFEKYGISPQPGGGRASARETACRCVAGAIAEQWLNTKGIFIYPYLQSVGPFALPKSTLPPQYKDAYAFETRCPNHALNHTISEALQQIISEGDSLGGVVACVIEGVPAGIGEPIYDKLSARLALAMMSINAAKGFELGSGFDIAQMRGSEANDPLSIDSDGKVCFASNHAGGVIGGISTGQEIFFRVAFKPTPTIRRRQETISIHKEKKTIEVTGRHDPAVVLRAVPVVGAMAALTLADMLLLNKSMC